ncbi:MAG: hypothetical protein LUE09_05320 [Synergistaceae bacterium]|nr:hypothetical protein [Synergistaceae bacterium]
MDDKVTSDKNKLYSNFGGVFKSAVLNAREALESYQAHPDINLAAQSQIGCAGLGFPRGLMIGAEA